MAQLKPMTGDEFVRKILAGEKDFSLIDLLDFDLSSHEGFEELQRYLKAQKLIENPLIISYSRFNRLKAKRLYAPYTRCVEACLKRADFEGADLNGAYFDEANLWRADFEGADLNGVKFMKASLEEADLRGADLRRTNFNGAYLGSADLRAVRNLREAIDLGHAIFNQTIVTPTEKEIIEKACERRNPFDLRDC